MYNSEISTPKFVKYQKKRKGQAQNIACWLQGQNRAPGCTPFQVCDLE